MRASSRAVSVSFGMVTPVGLNTVLSIFNLRPQQQ
jgi:hypothetical protein